METSDESLVVVGELWLSVVEVVGCISDPVAVDVVTVAEVSRDDVSSSQSSVDVSTLEVLVGNESVVAVVAVVDSPRAEVSDVDPADDDSCEVVDTAADVDKGSDVDANPDVVSSADIDDEDIDEVSDVADIVNVCDVVA